MIPVIPDLAERPTHVPVGQVFDFDVYRFPVVDGEFQSALLQLRRQEVPEVFWTPRNGGHWVVTRARDVQMVLETPDIFSSRKSSVPKALAPNPPLPPIQSDPPEHAQYRQLLTDTFSPRSVRRLEEAARALTIKLIDGFEPNGACEFIGEFATHLPIEIFMSIVDLPPSDRLGLLEISEACMRPRKPEDRVNGFATLSRYAREKIRERREKPGNDLISTVIAAEVNGQSLSDDTITNIITLVLTAGLDTVASMLGFVVHFLAHNDEHRRQLVAKPALIPRAAEEMLRRFAIATLAREVSEEVTLGQARLLPGDMVVVPTMLGNLDEEIFDEPLTVDFQRQIKSHYTFGAGPHRCIGSNLARAELKIFLEEWLSRIPDFAVCPNAMIEVNKRVVATMSALPLCWTPRNEQNKIDTAKAAYGR
ncbi:MAG: cytochrome P450 [Alphaproteobacteria bacterium]|nr:cytochrome P450 [Alphaproteobacteria bacterium]